MNSRERVFASARGQETDCFAVTPYNGNFSINVSGYELSECYTDGKKLAEAQIRAWELTGQDVVNAQSDQYYMSEGMGVKTLYRTGALPAVLDVPVKSLEDVKLIRPIDPYRDGRSYVYIEAIGLLSEHFKGEVAIRAPGAGPFPLCAHLMGVSEFITLLALTEAEEDTDSEKRIMDLLETVTESLCRFSEACLDAGADIVQCADSLASLNIISPAIYRKYAFPFEKKYFDRISARKKDRDFLTLLHICGNNSAVAEDLADTGCDILEVDYQVDLRDYKQRIGDRVCLMGNLNPAGAIFKGTPEFVEKEAREAIEAAGRGGRFCLGSGCEVAIHAPLENVRAMVRTGHSLKPDFSGRK